ncbi:MAG: hypothetical protein KKF41_10335 [Actinobacteria bacterium]|nr:hypothetical protein [Actinomycetota bacterium]MBU1943082.1 hypothetical protein [Actinomycetota bacterium]MBU2687971.1 hypothetical protein [Actinomycetota bacterium]
MRYCRGCGFPVPYGRFLQWTSDGTILGKDKGRTRLVYLEVDEMRHLYAGVSSWIGVPIDRIIYRAEKEVGRRFIETLLPAIISRMPRGHFRPEWGVKATAGYVLNYMSGLGMGHAEVFDYQSGRSSRVRIVNPHVMALIAGDAAGVFGNLERVPVEARWERIKTEEYYLYIEKEEGAQATPAIERLGLEEKGYLPGKVEFDACKCGVPLDVTRNIYLDLEKGILVNRVTGLREVALPVPSFDAVFREFTREFGADLPATMEDLEQEYARENSAVRYLAGTRGPESMMTILSDFPWRGIGNPVAAGPVQGGLQVVIENPFHAGVVAGRVAGLYEAWTGTQVGVSWQEDAPGRLRVTLTQ